MKSQQLLIAITLAETMSITKAARRLYLSQPGVSSSLKSLEAEIGFPIFHRTNKGLVITPKGADFMRCARSILEELHRIEGIAKSEERTNINFISSHSRRVERAFSRLCRAHREDSGLNLSMLNRSMNVQEAVSALYDGKADMTVSFCPPGVADQLESRLRGTTIRYGIVGSLPVVLIVAKGHRLSTGELTPERLSAETYINYRNLPESGFISPIYYQITPKNSISVDSRELRLNLLSEGLGFSVGMMLNEEELAHYGLIARPISDSFSDLCYLTAEAQDGRAILSEFIDLLYEECSMHRAVPSP